MLWDGACRCCSRSWLPECRLLLLQGGAGPEHVKCDICPSPPAALLLLWVFVVTPGASEVATEAAACAINRRPKIRACTACAVRVLWLRRVQLHGLWLVALLLVVLLLPLLLWG